MNMLDIFMEDVDTEEEMYYFDEDNMSIEEQGFMMGYMGDNI